MADAYTLHVKFKPNCGLENTRAALVMRRVESLCYDIDSYPSNVKGDQRTIRYLRDNGFFLRFTTKNPELALATAKTSFFVDECAFVDEGTAFPPYGAEDPEEAREVGADAYRADLLEADDESSSREHELMLLLSRLDAALRSLRAARAERPGLGLDEAVYDLSHVSDGLRNVVERDRMEPLDRIIAPLRLLVEDQARRFGANVRFEMAESHLSLDRSVLAMLEEAVRRVVRASIRCIEGPKERAAAEKPPQALITLEVESSGATAVCRITHDGRPFEARQYLRRAAESGLLARPLESYSDAEAGRMALMPRFMSESISSTRTGREHELSEIASMLQRFDARGEIRNTGEGTVEVLLRFPVPFTAFDAALFTVGDKHLAVQARHVERFEAFDARRVESVCASDGTAVYRSDDGKAYPLANATPAQTPFEATAPVVIMLMESRGARRALAVDSVVGYERILARKLPALLNGGEAARAGCIGYASLANGTVFAVISARDLPVAGDMRKGARHAR